jgi:hypothetical protein
VSDTAHLRITYLHAYRRGCLYRRRVPATLTGALKDRAVLEIPLPKVPPAEHAKLVEQHNEAFERTVASARAGRRPDAKRPFVKPTSRSSPRLGRGCTSPPTTSSATAVSRTPISKRRRHSPP